MKKATRSGRLPLVFYIALLMDNRIVGFGPVRRAFTLADNQPFGPCCHRDGVTIIDVPRKQAFGQRVLQRTLDNPFERTRPEHRS